MIPIFKIHCFKSAVPEHVYTEIYHHLLTLVRNAAYQNAPRPTKLLGKETSEEINLQIIANYNYT